MISFLNCLGPAIDLEKVKSECLELRAELRSTFSEEANTQSYYPAPAPVMDKHILDNGKVFQAYSIPYKCWLVSVKVRVRWSCPRYSDRLAFRPRPCDCFQNS